MSWIKQSQEPLFPEILWSRPENKRQAGKLLIIGGNLHAFMAVSSAYAAAEQAGAGTCKILLPSALQKTLSKLLQESEFTPSTLSGSFGRSSLDQFLDSAQWADCVLLAGDFGKNSETAILLESFLQKYTGPLVVAGDAIDYFVNKPDGLFVRENTVIVPTFVQLQKLLRGRTALNHTMGLTQLVDTLEEIDSKLQAIVTNHSEQVLVASLGRASTTTATFDQTIAASRAAVFWMQNPSKPFESITTAVFSSQ